MDIIPANTEQKERQRIPALDGIRGIAIVMVMLYHFTWFPLLFGGRSLWSASGGGQFYLLKILLSGWAGVDLFFVLSGYLITGILADTRADTGYFRSFYMRRFFRIFPLYLLFLILASWSLNFFPPQIVYAGGSYKIWLLTSTSNVLIAKNGWGSVPLPFQHVWSLAVEEQFYIVWPFIIFFLNRRKAIYFCLVLMAAALTARFLQHSWVANYVLTYTRFDALAAGSLLALVSREIKNRTRIRFWARLLAIFSFTALIAVFVLRNGLAYEDHVVATIGFSLLSLFFMAVIGMYQFGTGTLVERLLAVPPLRLLGRYSYGIYLIHQPVVIFLWSAGLMKRLVMLVNPGLESYRAAAIFLGLLVPMVISVSIATCSWHGFEKHFLTRNNRALEFLGRIKAAARLW